MYCGSFVTVFKTKKEKKRFEKGQKKTGQRRIKYGGSVIVFCEKLGLFALFS